MNNKGTDRTVRMHRKVCLFVFCMQQNQVFIGQARHIYESSDNRINNENEICAQQRFRPAWSSTPVKSDSSLYAQRRAKYSMFLHVHSKDTAMADPSLCWVAGGVSCLESFLLAHVSLHKLNNLFYISKFDVLSFKECFICCFNLFVC